MAQIKAYDFQNQIDNALEGLSYWEKEEISIVFTSIPQLDFGTVLLDKKKNILLINIHNED